MIIINIKSREKLQMSQIDIFGGISWKKKKNCLLPSVETGKKKKSHEVQIQLIEK